MMKACKYLQNVYFYVLNELDEKEKAAVEEHLTACPTCRQEKEKWAELINNLNGLAAINPDQLTLRTLRTMVITELQKRRVERRGVPEMIVGQSVLRPLQYIVATLILVALGFLMGRWPIWGNPKQDSILHTLLTANRQVRTMQSEIIPYLLDVDKVRVDPQNRQVEIRYNTVNDISFRGHLENPIVRELLLRALMEETNTPVRIQTLKTLAELAEPTKKIDPQFIQAIEYLLFKEQNTGVRLQAIKVLRALPFDETVRQILTRLLLYDSDAAVRIAAFEALTGTQAPTGEMQNYLRAAQKDTNSYIRYKANKFLQQIETKKVAEISREE